MIAGFDVFGALVLLFCALRVMSRGFVDELLSLSALVGGVIAAALLSGSAAQIVALFIEQRIWRQIVAFLVVFVVVYFVIKLIHRFLANALETLNLRNADRALGFFLGVLEGGAILVGVILILQVIPLVNEERILSESIIARLISPFVPTLLQVLRRG